MTINKDLMSNIYIFPKNSSSIFFCGPCSYTAFQKLPKTCNNHATILGMTLKGLVNIVLNKIHF